MTGLLWTLAVPGLIVAALAVSGARRRLRERRFAARVEAGLKQYPPAPVRNEETAGFLAWLKGQASRS